jgi:hypothetical protein
MSGLQLYVILYDKIPFICMPKIHTFFLFISDLIVLQSAVA